MQESKGGSTREERLSGSEKRSAPSTMDEADSAQRKDMCRVANSVGFHEDSGSLTPQTMDMHRALTSLQEELEAVDWYQQRVDAASDDELREILAHNRDEEKEHAAMVLEWIRRRDKGFDKVLRQYLFTSGNLLSIEKGAEGDSSGDASGDRRPTLGSLKGELS